LRGTSQRWISRAISMSRFIVTRSASSSASRSSKPADARMNSTSLVNGKKCTLVSERNTKTNVSSRNTRRGGESFFSKLQKNSRVIFQRLLPAVLALHLFPVDFGRIQARAGVRFGEELRPQLVELGAFG